MNILQSYCLSTTILYTDYKDVLIVDEHIVAVKNYFL